jgi:DNA-binding transcriptional MerR regulator
LLPPARSANGYRDYDAAVVDRLAFIRAAQASGLTLAEIRTVVAIRDRGEVPCEHVRALIDQRTAEIDRRMTELRQLREDLARLADRARHLDPADCDPTAVCHIMTPTPR